MIKRRKTNQVRIGRLSIGSNAPISIQSMTKTDTADWQATARQIKRLERAGCEIVRLAVKNEKAAQVLTKIKKRASIPIVADIHYNYRLALAAIDAGIDKIRINPGNMRKPSEVKQVVRAAKAAHIPIRIGLNSGSIGIERKNWVRPSFSKKLGLTQFFKTVQQYIKLFEQEKFYDIIISLKASDVATTVAAYREFAKKCKYPFHLGITASGLPQQGKIKSAIGIGALLLDGIGDTIRVSLTADPVEEVKAAKEILQALGLRRFGPQIISCPTCGRCQVGLEQIVKEVEKKLSSPRKRGSRDDHQTIAIMGCEVNGPGEAREADIGIAAGKGSGILFKKGKAIKKVKEKDFVKELLNYTF